MFTSGRSKFLRLVSAESRQLVLQNAVHGVGGGCHTHDVEAGATSSYCVCVSQDHGDNTRATEMAKKGSEANQIRRVIQTCHLLLIVTACTR